MSVAAPGSRWYNAVWRWHFYAGLFCIPFVLWLSCTGALYLWRPQIEAWLDRPYDHLATQGPVASPDAQVAAALRAVPGGTLHRYILPEAPDQAVRILVTAHGEDKRVYVDPRSLAVLKVVTEEKRPMRLIFHLHGELLAGPAGSYVVETAACWAIVMILTGLYLWWPRGSRGPGGVLYPRLRAGRRLFWRDMHAVSGIWVSLFALGLILTGLPWAAGWGSYLAAVRHATGAERGPIDWTVGGKAPDEHDGHRGMDMAMPMGGAMAMPAPPARPGELARVIGTARGLGFAAPVLLSPPAHAGGPWKVASDAADRPLRATATVDGTSGRLIHVSRFAGKHWIDRAVGYGVAAHEGALFGLFNQLLGTATALLLMTLAISGTVLWWRRRSVGLLGAPLPLARPRFGGGLVTAIALLALFLPMFGLTLIWVLLVERVLLARIAPVARWLGLKKRSAPAHRLASTTA